MSLDFERSSSGGNVEGVGIVPMTECQRGQSGVNLFKQPRHAVDWLRNSASLIGLIRLYHKCKDKFS